MRLEPMTKGQNDAEVWRSGTRGSILSRMGQIGQVAHGRARMRDRDTEDSTAPDETAAGIRIFLVADVRGYTSFTQERGDEAAARLAARFAEIVREHVQARDGSLIELRGDEALAVFHSPRQAIRAAVELQAGLLQATRAIPDLPLPVGIGLDAGEAVPVESGFRGGALNSRPEFAARQGLARSSAVKVWFTWPARSRAFGTWIAASFTSRGSRIPSASWRSLRRGATSRSRFERFYPGGQRAPCTEGGCISAFWGHSRWTREAAPSPSAGRSSGPSSRT